MSGEHVLIAAFSGRSLAQSARRAGFHPLVVDAFGDLDTREAAEDIRVIEGAMVTGFRTKPLVAALEEINRSAAGKPIGLVLGSGLEDKTRLIATLASRFRLLGSDAETVRSCKDPVKFFATLDRIGVAHPRTQTEPPTSPEGWISKRIGGSGGRHIRDCGSHTAPKPRQRRYFQQRLSGTRYSVGAVFSGSHTGGKPSTSFFLTRQWTAPCRTHPYRFGGCVSQPDIEPHLRSELIDIAIRAGDALKLCGMASFDFIVDAGKPFLLEVNPRPGASLDVLDSTKGDMFQTHVAAWTGGKSSSHWPVTALPKAMAILHADRGALVLGEPPWPNWSADRGASGTVVPKGAPLASVLADGPTADAAEALARQRLAELEDLIYEHANPDPTGVQNGK